MTLIDKKGFSVLLIFASISFDVFSQQYYSAGESLITYVDVIPDSVITAQPCWSGCIKQYNIDINGDNQNDIRLWSWSAYWHGAILDELEVHSLNENTFIRFGRQDSTYEWIISSWYMLEIADPLLFGEAINQQNALWKATNLYVKYNNSIPDWTSDTNDKYVGFKYQNGSDVIYGWIRLNLDGSGDGLIKDYSINSELKNDYNIYPNPSNDKLYIEQRKYDDIEVMIYDLQGKQTLATQFYYSKTFEIEVGSLNSGIYLIRFISGDHSLTKKIIIQRK